MGVNTYKVGHRSLRIILDRHYLVQLLDKQGEAIDILWIEVLNETTEIKIISNTKGYMELYFQNNKKDMGYYATKLHQFLLY